MLLDERKKRILEAVIEEYTATAEPVGSTKIANDYKLGFSPATIRNEMAELEKMGYLEKPHTSAGRVPSAKGYRYYVDELLQEDKITLDEIKYIRNSYKRSFKHYRPTYKLCFNSNWTSNGQLPSWRNKIG